MSDEGKSYLGNIDAEEAAERINGCLDLIWEVGQIEGDHHRAWVIDQITRFLTGNQYENFVEQYCDGEDGPDTYGWDEGIAP